MNQEIVNKLRGAGFPKVIRGYEPREIFWPEPDSSPHRLGQDANYVVPTIPTLSEIIEACGHSFYKLTLDKSTPIAEKRWLVDRHWIDLELNTFYGKTAEEAVASLWLALNKK